MEGGNIFLPFIYVELGANYDEKVSFKGFEKDNFSANEVYEALF